MAGTLLSRGSAESPPDLFLGRSKDLAELRKRLMIGGAVAGSGVLSLSRPLLKAARNAKGITQSALAERAGCVVETVKKAEREALIRSETAERIASVLNMSVGSLAAPLGESATAKILLVVTGLPGIGKTTLARALVHDEVTKRAFPDVLFVALGQSPDLLAELAFWGRGLGLNDLHQEKDHQKAHRRLAALLRDRRILLVIDDAWETEHARAMMVGGTECPTLVTTRIPEVADSLAISEDVYNLKDLSEDDALKLLESLASEVVAKNRNQTRELAEVLDCLPLALRVAGPLLQARARAGLGVADLLEELRDAAQLLQKIAPVEDLARPAPTVAALLSKSTEALDEPARRCFAYLGACAVGRFSTRRISRYGDQSVSVTGEWAFWTTRRRWVRHGCLNRPSFGLICGRYPCHQAA